MQIGSLVTVRGKTGVVKFIGTTSFADGLWVGIEMDSQGKNDGAVQGVRYFTCDKPGLYGLFVRPAIVKVSNGSMDINNNIHSDIGDTCSSGTSSRPGSPSRPESRPRSSVGRPSSPNRSSISSRSGSRPTTSVDRSCSPSRPRSSLNGDNLPNLNVNAPTPSLNLPKIRASSHKSSPVRSGNTGQSDVTGISTLSMSPTRNIQASMSGSPTRSHQMSVNSTGLTSPNKSSSMVAGGLGPSTPTRKSSARMLSGSRQQSFNLMSPPVLLPHSRTTSSRVADTSSLDSSRLNSSPKSDSRAGSGSLGIEPSSPFSYGSMNTSNANLQRQIETLKSKLKIMEKKRLDDRERLALMQADNKKVVRLENIIKRLQLKLTPMHEEIQSLREKLAKLESENFDLNNERDNELLELTILDKEMAEEKCASLAFELDSLKQNFEQLELECDVLREENVLYADIDNNSNHSTDFKEDKSVFRLQKRNDKLEEALLRLREYTTSQEATFQEKLSSFEQQAHEFKNVTDQFQITHKKLEEAEKIILDLRVQLDNALGAEDMIENLTEKNLELNEKCEELQNTIDELETLKDLNDELETNHNLREKQLLTEVENLESVIGQNKRKITELENRNEYLDSSIVKFRELISSLDRDITTLKSTNSGISNQEAIKHASALQDLNLKLASSSIESRANSLDLEIKKHESQQAIRQLEIVKCYMTDDYMGIERSVNVYLKLHRIKFESQLIRQHLKEKVVDFPSIIVNTVLQLVELEVIASELSNYLAEATPEQFKKAVEYLPEIESVEASLATQVQALRIDDFREEDFLRVLNSSLSRLQRIEDNYKIVYSAFNTLQELNLLVDSLCFLLAEYFQNGGKKFEELESISIILARLVDGVKEKPDKIFSKDQMTSLKDFKTSLQGYYADFIRFIESSEPDKELMFTSLKGRQVIESIKLIDLASRSIPLSPWLFKANQLKDLRGQHEELAKELEHLKLESNKLATALRVKDKIIEEMEVKLDILNAKVVKGREQEKAIAELKRSLASASAQEKVFIDATNRLKKTVEDQDRKLTKLKRSSIIGLQEGGVVPMSTINAFNVASEIKFLRDTVRYLSQSNSLLMKNRSVTLSQISPLILRKPVVQSSVRNVCQPLFMSLQNYAEEFNIIQIKIPKTMWESRQNSNKVRLFLQKERIAKVDGLVKAAAN